MSYSERKRSDVCFVEEDDEDEDRQTDRKNYYPASTFSVPVFKKLKSDGLQKQKAHFSKVKIQSSFSNNTASSYY